MADPVLLTGATGFVGRAVLAEMMARGVPVHAVSRRPGPPLAGVVWHSADLLTAAGRARVAGVAPRLIHCAWEVEHTTFWTSAANADWHAASLDLVRQFQAAGGTRVLALGTCAEYDATDAGPWNEDRPLGPATQYGQAKAALWRDLFELCGSDLTWARLFHLFGPGEDPRRLVPSLILTLSAGRRAVVKAPHLIRDYASTAHVARCLVDLLDAPLRGACDIGSGSPASLGDVARWIAGALDASDLLDLSAAHEGSGSERMTPELDRLRTSCSHLPADPQADLLRTITIYAPTFEVGGNVVDVPANGRS